jgi:uncharacterized protein YjbI with pentapeptide repeats
MLDDAREERVSQTGNGEPGTKEAEALAAALNHSAERVQTLWFSFLTFMLYLAIATGTTTHRMLFLESPLNLPVLNISLPLLGFYILTPVIFVVFHFYMLLNLVLLAHTARTFEDALERAFPEDGDARENFRMRIENTLFVQLLVGGRLEREGFNAKLLSLMALITLALAPVALLLMFEIKFLPYHSEWITWLHRGLLALDLALVWTLWPGYRSGWGVRLWPKSSWWLVAPGIGSAAALAYAAMVATFPDERIYVATHSLHSPIYLNPDTGEVSSPDRPNWYAFIAPVNTLDLHGEDLIDDAKLAHIIEKNESTADSQRWVATLSLAGRDLTGAGLQYADVRHVDFNYAILNRANLEFAWAEKALFAGAQLQGASLFAAQLQSARLDMAQLQGALLHSAKLQGASLFEAQLQGALLSYAQLQGALLSYAQLQGASLGFAQLQGASLDHAQLQGVVLNYASLQGVSLNNAQLQGASLGFAALQGGLFVDACVWRADARQAAWKDTWVAHLETGPKADKGPECAWTAASFAALKQLIAKDVPEGYISRAAMERIEQRLNPAKDLEGENVMAKFWAAREREAPTPEVYEKTLIGQWRELGCAAEGAPYVLPALIQQLRTILSPFSGRSDAAMSLGAAFLDDLHCAAAHGLSKAEIVTLRNIRDHGVLPAPKP